MNRRHIRWYLGQIWTYVILAFVVWVISTSFIVGDLHRTDQRAAHAAILAAHAAKAEAIAEAEVASRIAEKRSTETSNSNRCLASIPFLTGANAFVAETQNLRRVLLRILAANHKLTDPSSPLYAQQLKNIALLRANRVHSITFPVPTTDACLALRPPPPAFPPKPKR